MTDETPDGALRTRLLALFREELQDNVRALDAGRAQLSAPDGDLDGGVVDELFRAAHSLKGAAHSAGVEAAIEPARRLEGLLAALRAGERRVDDDLRSTYATEVAALIDLERRMADESRGGGGDDTVPADAAAPPVTSSRARVDVEALDELLREAGTLLSATQRLGLLRQRATEALVEATAPSPRGTGGTGQVASLTALAEAAEGADREIGAITTRLVGSAQRLRLQRVGDVVAGLDAAVEELCRSTGKQVRFIVEGGDVEVDRDIGDAIREPLLHLVRNAVDHGIEAPERRRQLGKPQQGTVRVQASLEGALLRVAVIDDGGGLDVDALRRAAADPSASDADIIERAFLPGVSTAAGVTDVSGRGVGLDAVRSRAESLGGTVRLGPAPERPDASGGTEAVLEVLMTMASMEVLVVVAGGELVALPARSVERLERVTLEDLEHVEGRVFVRATGDPVVQLAHALGLPPDASTVPVRTLVHLVGEPTRLLIEGVEAKLECVLRPLPARVATSAALGAVVLPTGEVALVTNPAHCVRAASGAFVEPAAAQPRRATILLAEDTFTTRALEHSILAGAGYEVVDAVDGAEAWSILQDRSVDLIVSDVDMPRMGGIDLCRAVRSSARTARIPVVLVTSLASEDDRRRGVEAGADTYLVKSAFDQAALLDAVRRLV